MYAKTTQILRTNKRKSQLIKFKNISEKEILYFVFKFPAKDM